LGLVAVEAARLASAQVVDLQVSRQAWQQAVSRASGPLVLALRQVPERWASQREGLLRQAL